MSVWGQIVDAMAGKVVVSVKKKYQRAIKTHKVCTVCKQNLPRTDYYLKSGKASNAITAQCKACFKKQQAVRQAKAKERAAMQAQIQQQWRDKLAAGQRVATFTWPEDQ